VQGYASVPAWTVHSLRIYNRVLSEAEVAHNSSLDSIRYLNPPSVTVGGNACTEVVVLSPKTLICKVPVGTEGVVDVVIDNVSLPGVYQYVDATSAFYVSSITPIIGPAAGTTLTLTGNKLNEISEIKAGDAVCTNLAVSGDQKSCTVTLPAHPEGEVDIIVITTDGKRYRFAKIFEYKG
jgi:hypothetical protein